MLVVFFAVLQDDLQDQVPLSVMTNDNGNAVTYFLKWDVLI